MYNYLCSLNYFVKCVRCVFIVCRDESLAAARSPISVVVLQTPKTITTVVRARGEKSSRLKPSEPVAFTKDSTLQLEIPLRS